MKTIVLLIFLLFNSQNGNKCFHNTNDEPILYIYADKLPKFNYNGGLHDYIYTKLQWLYQLDIYGKVLVSFVVQKDGKVKNVKIERSLSPICDDEVIRIIESMPDWEPGELDSKSIDIKLYFPVEFKLKE